jgi:hypothetical protein
LSFDWLYEAMEEWGMMPLVAVDTTDAAANWAAIREKRFPR